MQRQQSIQLFEEKTVRTLWDAVQEKWYFSIVDVVAVLTDSPNPQVYWRVLKKRLLAEGNETVTKCNGLKMRAADGKMRLTDVADTSESNDPETFSDHMDIAQQGGEVARNARLELEAKTGRNVISPLNAKDGITLKGLSTDENK